MKKEDKGWIKEKIKGVLSLVANSCVVAFTTAGTTAVIPVTMINPVLGVMIVTGNVVLTSTLADTIISPCVSDAVEGFCDIPNQIRKAVEDIQEIANNVETENESQNKEGKAE